MNIEYFILLLFMITLGINISNFYNLGGKERVKKKREEETWAPWPL